MADDKQEPELDLAHGVPVGAIPTSGLLAGKVGDEAVVLVRGHSGFAAIGAKCTHLGAPMVQGMVVGDTVRCPWHHACFDLESGTAIAAPAFTPLPCWIVEQRDGLLFVRGRQAAIGPAARRGSADERVVIVGAGAAGYAAADALLKLGYAGVITVIGNDSDVPYDRTLLTKDFLEGKVGEDKLPIEGEGLAERGVDLRLGQTVVAIEPAAKLVRLADATTLPFTKLVLATGAEPNRLTIPGAELGHVITLRTAEDARAILAQGAAATKIVVIGGSFIGLEAAAALRTRDFDIAVVAPDQHPFAKVFGPEISDAILAAHRAKGVTLHLGRTVVRIEPDRVELDDGTVLAADLVVVGIGVSPRIRLAEHAGLAVDDGVVVDEHLRTSNSDIYAVGDIARWPDPHSGERIGVEHWNVAVRQGQVAALNIAGEPTRYDVVPFFWTKHFDFSVRCVGHATEWDRAELEGDLAKKDAEVRLSKDGRHLALLTVDRDGASLQEEVEMERKLGEPAATLSAGR